MSPSYAHAAIAAMLITEINNTRKFRAFSELTLVIGERQTIFPTFPCILGAELIICTAI
ncbi:MAG: hypothetical protein ACTFAK_06950 [Candidatus Electronema sp. VV]